VAASSTACFKRYQRTFSIVVKSYILKIMLTVKSATEMDAPSRPTIKSGPTEHFCRILIDSGANGCSRTLQCRRHAVDRPVSLSDRQIQIVIGI